MTTHNLHGRVKRKVTLVDVHRTEDPETYTKVHKFLEEHPELGYHGEGEFILMACLVRLAEFRKLGEDGEPRP